MVNFYKYSMVLAFWLLLSCAEDQTHSITSGDIATRANGSLLTFFECLRDNNVTLVSAHRGGSRAGYPENGIETFELTTSEAAVIVEMDVVETSDGVLVVIHDSSLDRTTNMSGPVSEKSWEEIRSAHLVDHLGVETTFNPPSLMQTLEWAKDKTLLQIDMKPPVDVDDVVGQVIEAKATGRVFYIAYSIEDAKRIIERLPSAFVSIGIADQDDLEDVLASGVNTNQIHALARDVEENQTFLETLNSLGITTVGLTFDLPFERGGANTELDWQKVVRAYKARADSGIEILASNRPVDAFNALSADPAYQDSLHACLAGL